MDFSFFLSPFVLFVHFLLSMSGREVAKKTAGSSLLSPKSTSAPRPRCRLAVAAGRW
jgi:hypothetical protein